MTIETTEDTGASRRSMLKSGALGVGALATAIGVVNATASGADADAAIPAPPTTATDNVFLKIPGITGSSTTVGHVGEIPLLTFDFGITNSAKISSGGGGGSGKAAFAPITFTARTSQASPDLFKSAVSGQHLASAVIAVARKGSRNAFLTITLTEVLISGYELAADPAGGLPLDQVSLVFGKIQYSFAPQRPDGSIGTANTTGWDVTTNKRI
jgi:type VI secretion system secreted protein Hcp